MNCRSLRILTTTLILSASATALAQRASFDCEKVSPRQTAENIICDSNVGLFDRALDTKYREALAIAHNEFLRDELKRSQRRWIKDRNERCIGRQRWDDLKGLGNPAFRKAEQCMTQMYAERIVAVQDRIAPPLVPQLLHPLKSAAEVGADQSDPGPLWDQYPVKKPDDAYGAVGNARFVAWAQNIGHGHIDLMLGRAEDLKSGAAPRRLIAGEHELETVQFDVEHSFVFYATDLGVIAHDLERDEAHRIDSTRLGDVPIAYSAANRTLVLERVAGCRDLGIIATPSDLPDLPRTLCAFRLPPY